MKKRSALTPQQEREIYPLLDRALELPYGKAIVYPCAPTRAEYLTRVITGERHRSAIEAIASYPPDDPLHGVGLFGKIWVEPHPKGLVLANLNEPRETLAWLLIQCAATKKPHQLHNTYGVSVSRLNRFKERYPEIMGPVWVDPGPPVVARFGEPDPEELVIVDIDVQPDRPVNNPTQEEYAKSQYTAREAHVKAMLEK